MFKNDSQSINQLLSAEKRAEEKINQARKRKHQRFKQAKEDAMAEINIFKNDKEKNFKEFESKFLGAQESSALKMEQETDRELHDMIKHVKLNKNTIIPYLLDQVFNINCDLHANFKPGVY